MGRCRRNVFVVNCSLEGVSDCNECARSRAFLSKLLHSGCAWSKSDQQSAVRSIAGRFRLSYARASLRRYWPGWAMMPCSSSAREGFRIRGLLLTTDLEGSWSTSFPEVEIRGKGMSGPGGGLIASTVESAFQHFIDSGDYAAADKLASQCPDDSHRTACAAGGRQ